MTYLFYAAAVLLVLVVLATAFVRVNPSKLAGAISVAGPVAVGLAGVGLILVGRIGFGAMALSAAAAWYARGRLSTGKAKTPGRRSTVRTAALEMDLDHDTGALEGVVLAGQFDGRVLRDMDLPMLLALRVELSGDPESLQLLETYLDGRSPVWRKDAEPDGDGREGVPPRSGPMTEKEAYQVLGLEPGAGAADIRKAHRRLMQRLHPDLGGSSFLAARINEAKDVLLSNHR